MPYSRKRLFPKRRSVPKKRTFKRSRYTRRSNLTSLIRRVVSRSAESKVFDRVLSKAELYHNTPALILINGTNAFPPQGNTGSTRVGDEIYAKGYKLRILFGQKGDRPNVSFRIIVGYVNKSYSYGYSNWFRAITGNTLLDPVNPDIIKVVKSYTMRPNQAGLTATGNDEFTFAHQLYIPVNKKVRFPSGTQDADMDNLYMFIIPYDAFGSLTTDNIAYYQAASSLHYKDI